MTELEALNEIAAQGDTVCCALEGIRIQINWVFLFLLIAIGIMLFRIASLGKNSRDFL